MTSDAANNEYGVVDMLDLAQTHNKLPGRLLRQMIFQRNRFGRISNKQFIPYTFFFKKK